MEDNLRRKITSIALHAAYCNLIIRCTVLIRVLPVAQKLNLNLGSQHVFKIVTSYEYYISRVMTKYWKRFNQQYLYREYMFLKTKL